MKKKLVSFLIIFIMLPLVLVSCKFKDEEEEDDKPDNSIKLEVNDEKKKLEISDSIIGIKKYPDVAQWHIEFSKDSEYFVVKLPDGLTEGTVLDNNTENEFLEITYKVNGTDYSIESNSTFALTITEKSEDKLAIEFEGELRDFYFSDNVVSVSGSVKCKIDLNQNPATYSGSFDNYDDDDTIEITMPVNDSLLLKGYLNSMYGSAKDYYKLTFTQPGTYEYTIVKKQVRLGSYKLEDSDDNVLTSFSSVTYQDVITDANTVRDLSIVQGSEYWILTEEDSGKYEFTIKKVQ